MLKKLTLLAIALFTTTLVWSQTTVAGFVFDYEKKTFPLENVRVSNVNNKRAFAITSEKGNFIIAAKVGDLLTFSRDGYVQDTLLIISLQTKHVFLSPLRLDINGVEINSTKLSPYLILKDPEAIASSMISTDGLRNKENTDRAGGIRLNLGYGKFKKAQEKAAELESLEFYEAEIRENFTDKKIFELVKLTGNDLRSFMNLYRPTADQVRIERPFNYSYYISSAYVAWQKLTPEQKKMRAFKQP